MDESMAVYCSTTTAAAASTPLSDLSSGGAECLLAPFDTNKLPDRDRDSSVHYHYEQWPCLLAPSKLWLPSHYAQPQAQNDVVVCEVRVLLRGGFKCVASFIDTATVTQRTLVVFATTDANVAPDSLTVNFDNSTSVDNPTIAQQASVTVCTPTTTMGNAVSFTFDKGIAPENAEELLNRISVSFGGNVKTVSLGSTLSDAGVDISVQSEAQKWDGGRRHALRLSGLHLKIATVATATTTQPKPEDIAFDAKEYGTVRVAHVVTVSASSGYGYEYEDAVLNTNMNKILVDLKESEKLQLDKRYNLDWPKKRDSGIPRIVLMPTWRASQLQGILPEMVMAASGTLCPLPKKPRNPSKSALQALKLGSHGPEAAAAVGFFTDQITQLANAGAANFTYHARVRARMAAVFLKKFASSPNQSFALLRGDPLFASSISGKLAAHAVDQLSHLALHPDADGADGDDGSVGDNSTKARVLKLLSQALEAIGAHPNSVGITSYPSLQIHQLIRLDTHQGEAINALRTSYARCSSLLGPLIHDRFRDKNKPSLVQQDLDFDRMREHRLLDCIFRANPAALIEIKNLTRSGGVANAAFQPNILDVVDAPTRKFFSTAKSSLDALQVALIAVWRARRVDYIQPAEADVDNADSATRYTGTYDGGTPPFKTTRHISVMGVRRITGPPFGGGEHGRPRRAS